MAAITRTAAEARPTNDVQSIEVTMGVAVSAGQLVYIASTGLGLIADSATAPQLARGVATMDCPIGRAVAIVTRGKFGGWSGMTPGSNVFLNPAGEAGTAAGVVSQIIGYAVSATDIYVEL